MIHREDNLTDLLYQFVGAGYSPGVNFESGRINALKLELNKIFCIIQTRQLIKSAIDGVVVVDNEEVYNNMNQAMSTLSSKLFLKNHLSFYTEKDSEVLDSYRTKPICGNLCMQQKSDKLIEIDVSKVTKRVSIVSNETSLSVYYYYCHCKSTYCHNNHSH